MSISQQVPLVAYYSVYNEAEYLKWSYDSIYPYVDKIYIIEGAFVETFLTNGGNQRSNDGTIKVLEHLEDPENKIDRILFTNPGFSQLPQRNMILKMLQGEECWMLLVDGDEVYKSEDLIKLRKILNETDAECVKINSYTFINDFYHYTPIAFPRAFRLHNNHFYHFTAPNTIAKDGIKMEHKSYENEVVFYHYSYVKDPERFREKRRERVKLHGKFSWDINEDNLIFKCGTGMMGKLFKGDHPEIMKTHPLHGVKRI